MQLGEVIGNANVAALIGNAYRQNTYNHSYQNCYLQIINNYAIGKVTASGEVGGLIGQLANTYYGSTTTTNSYWIPETTNQASSKAGTSKTIENLLYKLGYTSWDFSTVWKIDSGKTIAYLQATGAKPDSIKEENIVYTKTGTGEQTGTEVSPYIITTPDQLQQVNNNLTAYYKLGSNIDLTGYAFTPIGNATTKFTGTLDGNGYTISNLNINSSTNYQGLIGYNSGVLKNINLQNIAVTGTTYIGGLAGYNAGTITDCTVNAIVTGTGYVGGITGYSSQVLQNCTTSGTITSTGDYAGGIAGYVTSNVTNSKSTSNVQGLSYTGGLIGYVYAGNKNITIENTNAEGNVTGTANVGGLIGSQYIYHTYGADSVTYSTYLKKSYASRKCNCIRR